MLCALQVKTCYSILSSLNRIDDLTKRAKEMGYSSLAITDVNNMFGVYEFYLSCLNNGIKPIIGMEVKSSFDDYILINPKVISYSEEMIYAGEGEGCLSVNREVEGIVPRHARITVEAYDLDGNKHKYRVREDLAIAFQHELDHLNGILFVDRINKNNPFEIVENSTPVKFE